MPQKNLLPHESQPTLQGDEAVSEPNSIHEKVSSWLESNYPCVCIQGCLTRVARADDNGIIWLSVVSSLSKLTIIQAPLSPVHTPYLSSDCRDPRDRTDPATLHRSNSLSIEPVLDFSDWVNDDAYDHNAGENPQFSRDGVLGLFNEPINEVSWAPSPSLFVYWCYLIQVLCKHPTDPISSDFVCQECYSNAACSSSELMKGPGEKDDEACRRFNHHQVFANELPQSRWLFPSPINERQVHN